MFSSCSKPKLSSNGHRSKVKNRREVESDNVCSVTTTKWIRIWKRVQFFRRSGGASLTPVVSLGPLTHIRETARGSARMKFCVVFLVIAPIIERSAALWSWGRRSLYQTGTFVDVWMYFSVGTKYFYVDKCGSSAIHTLLCMKSQRECRI